MQVLFQSEYTECGLATIAMVASAHGYVVDLPSLRARYPVSFRGTTLQDIVSIADDIGLESRAISCDVSDLRQLSLPAILHWRMNHFVVLARCRRDSYILHDPAFGRVVVTASEMNKSFTGVALEVWKGPQFQKEDLARKLRIGSVIPKSPTIRKAIVLLLLYALGIELTILVVPILQQIIIDEVLISQDTDLLLLVVIATGVFLVGKSVTQAVRSLIQRNLQSSLSLIVPSHVFQHMAGLPVSWFSQRSAADVVNRYDSVNYIHSTLTKTVIDAWLDGFVAILTLTAMALYSVPLALIVVLATFLYGLIRVVSFRSYRLRSHNEIIQRARVEEFLWETMRGIATIKLFSGVSQRQSGYVARLSRYIAVRMQILTADTAFVFAQDLIAGIEKVAVLYVGALLVLSGEFTIGMLIAFLSFRDNFVTKGSSLIDAAIEFRMLGVHLDRIADILLSPLEHKTRLPFLGERPARGELEIQNVWYRYGEHEADVLRNCCLKISSGEAVAIVGPSGSGKSTLFKVLTGEVQPRQGEVLIDGVSLNATGYERLRGVMSVVSQNDMLFGGTIAENIAFLDESPNHDQIRAVAKMAQIAEEIERMPMGYNSLVGTMGTGLSGGQVQRLMIARALYRSPRILLLDEATSSLDMENEKKISEVLSELRITRVVIAHRQETIARADRVVDITEINVSGNADVVPIHNNALKRDQ